MADKSGEINWFDGMSRSVTPPRPMPAVPVPVKPDNRRRHARFRVDSTQVILHRDSFLAALSLGSNKARKVCDLSEGGARILVSEQIDLNQKVRLKITLEKYRDEIEIGGEVKWCYPSTNGKDFYVGIKFSSGNPATARKMSAVQQWFTSPQYQALRSRR